MLDLGTLRLLVKADTSDATKELGNFSTKTEESTSKFSGFVSKAKGLVAGGAVALAVGAAAGKVKSMVENSLQATDTIDKMSQKIGISKTSYQEWNHVCSQSGVDIGVFKNGIKTLVTQMDAAQGGSKSAQAAFQSLGLSWQDGTGKLKSQEEMMNEAVSALAGMANGSERARLSTELFGKAGTELAPILNSGKNGIADLKKEAHDLGLVMSDEDIDSGVKLGDTIENLKGSFEMLGTKLAAKLYPIIQQVASWVIDHMPEIQAVVNTVFDAVSSVIDTLSPIIQALGSLISAVVTQAQKDGTVFNAIWGVIKAVVSAALTVIQNVIKLFSSAIKGDWKGCWDAIVNIVKSIGGALQAAGKAIFGKLWDGIKAVWNSIKGWASTAFDGFVSSIENFANKFLEAGKKLFTNFWNGLKNIWNDIWNWVSEKVNAIIQAFENALGIGDKAEGKTGKSHRIGLDYVPYDGYQAILHKGEMVLTAAEADKYNNQLSQLTNAFAAITAMSAANTSGDGQINLTVQLGTDKFGEAVVKYGDAARSNLGTPKVVTI